MHLTEVPIKEKERKKKQREVQISTDNMEANKYRLHGSK